MFVRTRSSAGVRINAPQKRIAKHSSSTAGNSRSSTPTLDTPLVSASIKYSELDAFLEQNPDAWRGEEYKPKTWTVQDVHGAQLTGAIQQQLERIADKRNSDKAEALKRLSGLLKHNWAAEAMDDNRETVLEEAVKTIKRITCGFTNIRNDKLLDEVVNAASLVALWFVTLADDLEELATGDLETMPLYEEVAQVLRAAIIGENWHPNDVAKVLPSLIRALATACFVTADLQSPTNVDALLTLCVEQLRPLSTHVPAEVTTALLSAFGLVYSTLDADSDAARTHYEAAIDKHIALLSHSSTDVRVASGENIGLMYSILRSASQDRRMALSKHTRHSSLIDTLYELVDTREQYVSLRDTALQRSAFRDILATVESHESPSVRIKIRTRMITFTDWRLIHRLNGLRDVLDAGFHVHFYDNPFVQDTFGVEFDKSSPKQEDGVVGGRKGDRAGDGVEIVPRIVVHSRSDLAKQRSIADRHSRTSRRERREVIDDGRQ
ncbi:hypothetical protein GQ42DRAFT_164390 [Ramicandelaber brevisporus]|nr:hypothetical protein GQ42DRAFT_164390 [Ramicandelaber brevisporus]